MVASMATQEWDQDYVAAKRALARLLQRILAKMLPKPTSARIEVTKVTKRDDL